MRLIIDKLMTSENKLKTKFEGIQSELTSQGPRDQP